MKLIDLNDWTQTGGGAVGTSYFHKTDPTLMLKFMSADVSMEQIEKELAHSRGVYNMGLPTPRPGELVTDGQRRGLVFERIVGKRSFAKMIGEEPENIDTLARQFAEVTKLLHSTPCDKTVFPNVKDCFGKMIRDNKFRSDSIKEKALNMLNAMPDADTCLHGDLHFGNIIQADGKSYLIDLLDFCYGYPLLDFGAILSLLQVMKYMEPIFVREYHCSLTQAAQFWHTFQKAYFGEDTNIAENEEMLRPYVAIKTLCMETESGVKIPDTPADIVYSILA